MMMMLVMSMMMTMTTTTTIYEERCLNIYLSRLYVYTYF